MNVEEMKKTGAAMHQECVEDAVAMACATLHKMYEENEHECHLTESEIRSVACALQVIETAQRLNK